jgi:hypothetical protein
VLKRRENLEDRLATALIVLSTAKTTISNKLLMGRSNGGLAGHEESEPSPSGFRFRGIKYALGGEGKQKVYERVRLASSGVHTERLNDGNS